MNKILSLLLLLVSVVGSASAQKAQPIWQPVFTNRTTNGVSSDVKNVGQTFHQVYALFANSGGVCTPSADFSLEGAYDGVNYIQFSPAVSPSQTGPIPLVGTYMNMSAVGSYPFIRVRMSNITANCSVNAYYTGSLDGGGGNSQLATLTNLGMRANWGRSAAGAQFITNYDSQFRNSIYFLEVMVEASANPATINIEPASVTNTCPGSSGVGYNLTFAANTTQVRSKQFPFTGNPHFISPVSGLGSAWCLYSTVGEQVVFNVQYRKE